MKRVRVDLDAQPSKSLYFGAADNVEFIDSGCHTLNKILGGGWAEGRIINVVGDKSTGKTLLAIETCANFNRKHPKGLIYYDDAEAAFDDDYAVRLGLPPKIVKFKESNTVEELFRSLDEAAARGVKLGQPVLYIMDSMDSLSDLAEMNRDMEKGTYGTKAAQLSTLFRKSVRKLKQANVTLWVISQIRDNIGVMFGKKHKRSGGKSLDFYASQVLWLAEKQKLSKMVSRAQRVYGVEIRGKVEKNKVGLPFRECFFPIIFYYGVDDAAACFSWLKDNKAKGQPEIARLAERAADGDRKAQQILHDKVDERWVEIEEAFVPSRRKYG